MPIIEEIWPGLAKSKKYSQYLMPREILASATGSEKLVIPHFGQQQVDADGWKCHLGSSLLWKITLMSPTRCTNRTCKYELHTKTKILVHEYRSSMVEDVADHKHKFICFLETAREVNLWLYKTK